MRLTATLRTLTYATALTGLILGQAWAVRAEDRVSTESRLPPGVLFYLSCPNLTRSYEDFQKTNFGRLAQDAELEDFRMDLLERIEDAVKDVEGDLEMPLSDLAALVSGEVTLAVIRPPDESLGGVALIQIGDHQDILDRLLAKAEESWNATEETIEKEQQTVADVEVTVCTLSSGNGGLANKPVTVVYAVHEDFLIVANSVSMMEEVLVRWDGQHDDTFAEDLVYQKIMENCLSSEKAVPAMKWFFDPIGLVSAVLSMSPETQLYAAMFNGYLPALGLNGFQGIGGASELATEEYDSVNRYMFYVEPPPVGAIKFFEFRPTISAPPSWVPADAGQFFACDWNLEGAYNTVESIYDSLVGPGAFEAMVNQAAQQGEALKAHPHPKQDIVDVLSGVVQGYLNTTLHEDGPPTMEGVIAVGLTDETKGITLLETLLDQAGGSVKSEFEGTTIYHSIDEDKPAAIAVKNQMILIGFNEERLKQALSGAAEEPLEATDGFAAIQEKLPEKVSLLAYQNVADTFQAGYESIRAGDLNAFTEGHIDFSILPPFDVIRRYLAPSASYFIPNEFGAVGVQFTLKSE